MSVFLHTFADKVKESGSHIFSVGEIIGDGEPEVLSFAAHNPCQDVYSVAKAFTVTAIGILSDRGLLSADEIITDVLGEACPRDCMPIWRKTTLDMLLLHQVALPGGFLDIDCQDANAFGADYLSYVLRYPLPPDAVPRYAYTDAAFYLLARAAEKRADMPLDTFLWKELFYPMQCREAAWSHCPQGHVMGATGLYIRTEDMLHLGKLYLNGGVWRGRRILSEQWVHTVLTRGYELRPVGIGKAYGKGGMRGQMLLVIPEQHRVVAWQACEENPPMDFVRFAAEYRETGA